MTEDPYARKRQVDGMAVARTGAGFLVLLLGTGVALWILSLVVHVMSGEDLLPVVERIVTAATGDEDLLRHSTYLDGKTLGLVAGYLVAVFLLSLAAGIAKAIIKAGVDLMSPDYKKVLAELKKELQKGKAAR